VLPAPATALVLGDEATDQGLDTLWALHAGGLSTVTPRLEGGAALTRTLALPGADPVAVTSDGALTYILDRASESVLVFDGDRPRATLPVGSRPSALVYGSFDGDDRFDLAVANEGSDDVSIILGGPDSTFEPERRVAVGGHPRALIEADLDHAGGLDLAVANSGSNTVSLLLGDDKGGFARAGGPAGRRRARRVTPGPRGPRRGRDRRPRRGRQPRRHAHGAGGDGRAAAGGVARTAAGR
jgi:DNA-binding beta-propeller fold protein YncE